MNRRKFMTTAVVGMGAAAIAPLAVSETPTWSPSVGQEAPPEREKTQEERLSALMRTSAGRQKLAASLMPSLSKRLTRKRELNGLSTATVKHCVPVEGEHKVFFAMIHIQHVRDKNFRPMATAINSQLSVLVAEEAELLKARPELKPLPLLVFAHDEHLQCKLGFALIQQYTV